MSPHLIEKKVEKAGGQDTDAFPDLPGISVKSGLRLVGGNRNLYRKLLSQFRSNYANVVSDIKSALEEEDTEVAVRIAHTIKGVSGNLGINDLFQVAAELEKAAKEGDRPSFEPLVKRFTSHLNIAISSIEDLDHKEASNQSSGTSMDKDTVKNF